jgi:hypothetical protein
MTASACVWITFGLAVFPAGLFLWNLVLYRRAPQVPTGQTPPMESQEDRSGQANLPAVSILIPARNEADSIRDCVIAAAATRGVSCEIVVLDDHSTDDTFQLVEKLAQQDPRIRVQCSEPLPSGWAGKQFACAQLAELARYPLLLFLDADVRLDRLGVSRMVLFLEKSGADLVSGVPRQCTSTWLDWLLIPLIHFILLGFLPLVGMRLTRWTAFGAGCGQLFLARRDAYQRSGGHRSIRQSLHDGVKLPRVFRQADAQTDLVDATDLAECQMYVSARDTWEGLRKNAVEGLAAPQLIVFATILLAGGQVLPFLVLAAGLIGAWPASMLAPAGAAVIAAYLPRWMGAFRFGQPWGSAWLHPFAICLFLIIQWSAFFRWLLGRPASWKGRHYAGSAFLG